MHIGTGKYEGKEIRNLSGEGSDSSRTLTVKEEIFTIIGTRIGEATVLDLNDANGMYGLEALSRGAKCCRFVNPNENEIKLTSENIKRIGLDARGMIFNSSPKEYLGKGHPDGCADEKYDVVFFQMRAKEDFEILDMVLGKQGKSGITVLIYPDAQIFQAPANLRDCEIVENRQFEDKKVAIYLKKCG